MDIIVAGFGTVGQGLVRVLRDKGEHLKAAYGFAPRVIGVVTGSHGTLFDPDGLDLDQLLLAAYDGAVDLYSGAPVQRGLSLGEMLDEERADTLVEATPSNFNDAQPALRHCLQAFAADAHVVLANKGPVALAYPALMQAAASAGRQLRFEATVMAGTPAISLLQNGLAGARIREVRGILNGTSNYILSQMETGMDFDEALELAQVVGYAESDPTDDISGRDAAGKALILSAVVFQRPLVLADVRVQGIRELTRDDIGMALEQGERVRLVVHVSEQGARVAPEWLPIEDPLARVSGAMNAISFNTDVLNEVTLVGAGAGGLETGFGLLADLLAIHRSTRRAGGDGDHRRGRGAGRDDGGYSRR
jgi:homoserine dehydrogenase